MSQVVQSVRSGEISVRELLADRRYRRTSRCQRRLHGFRWHRAIPRRVHSKKVDRQRERLAVSQGRLVSIREDQRAQLHTSSLLHTFLIQTINVSVRFRAYAEVRCHLTDAPTCPCI